VNPSRFGNVPIAVVSDREGFVARINEYERQEDVAV